MHQPAMSNPFPPLGREISVKRQRARRGNVDTCSIGVDDLMLVASGNLT